MAYITSKQQVKKNFFHVIFLYDLVIVPDATLSKIAKTVEKNAIARNKHFLLAFVRRFDRLFSASKNTRRNAMFYSNLDIGFLDMMDLRRFR